VRETTDLRRVGQADVQRVASKALASVAACTAALLAPSAASACPSAYELPTQLTAAEAKASVTCLINKERSRNDVRRLRPRDALGAAASGHSLDMVASSTFSHSSPDGASPIARVRASGYLKRAKSWSVGENLHWGTGTLGTPRATVSAWMSSGSHRQTLLNPRWRHLGIGFTSGSPRNAADFTAATYTADFGYRKR
jgi:uncharacterized protein YkwD